MSLVQRAGVSFVDVAILRFLLLAFMKAFQDRRAARQDCQKAGAPAESDTRRALSLELPVDGRARPHSRRDCDSEGA
jgi:hypothetical protein